MSYMDDDDRKYVGPSKKAEVSRRDLLGVSGPRVPKARAKAQAAAAAANSERRESSGFDSRVTSDSYEEYDPNSDNPLRRAEQRELEQLAVKKSKEVTSDLRNVLKISEDTRDIGAQTLVTLKEQGDQIRRTHEKVVQLDQEMAQGEKLLSKLGGMFAMPWKAKKGKKITGPEYRGDSSGGRDPNEIDAARRKELLGDKSKGGEGRKQTGHGNYLDEVEDETNEQDEILDLVSDNLTQLKNMALEMGNEMKVQDKDLDSVAEDVVELNSRQKQANQKSRRILGRRG